MQSTFWHDLVAKMFKLLIDLLQVYNAPNMHPSWVIKVTRSAKAIISCGHIISTHLLPWSMWKWPKHHPPSPIVWFMLYCSKPNYLFNLLYSTENIFYCKEKKNQIKENNILY